MWKTPRIMSPPPLRTSYILRSRASYRLMLLLATLLPAPTTAHLTFTSTPLEVQVPVTRSLHMRCSLMDQNSTSSIPSLTTTTTVSTGLVGRSVPKHHSSDDDADVNSDGADLSEKGANNRVLPSDGAKSVRASDVKWSSLSATDDPVLHLASLSITRDGQQIATVSPFSSAIIESDIDRANLHLSGDVLSSGNSTNGELGFLDLSWNFPRDSQTGRYECKAVGITKSGHAVTFTQSLVVAKSTANLDDIITEISNLKKTVLEQQAQIANQTARDAILQAQMDANEKRMQSQIDALKDDVKESRHVETGWVDCDDSDDWPAHNHNPAYHSLNYFDRQRFMTATFKSGFKSPPVVFLSLSNLFMKGVHDIEYAVQVVNVTSQGFVMRCGVNDEPQFHVEDMEVTWIAVPA